MMHQPGCRFLEADDNDFQRIASFLDREQFGLRREEWIRWKYRANPMGRGRIFVVENEAEAILGMLGFLPHVLYDPVGDPLTVMGVVDGYISRAGRGRNLYRDLLRLGQGLGMPLLAYPNRHAVRGLLQVGFKLFSPMERWLFPVVSDVGVKGRGTRWFAPAVAWGGRAYGKGWLGRRGSGVALKKVCEFEHDFSGIGEKSVGGRSASFLNWRFVRNPLRRFLPFEMCRDGDRLGYCVLAKEGDSVNIYGFYARSHLRDCLREVVEYCRMRKVNKLFFQGSGLGLWPFGFVRLRASNNIYAFDIPARVRVTTLCDSDW